MDIKQLKYTSHEIQNELPTIMAIMAQQVLRKIICQFQSKYYTIMIDGTTDVSNAEQVVFVIRWVTICLSMRSS